MYKRIRCVVIPLLLLIFFSVQSFAASIEYSVVSGDTLWKISQNFKVPVDAIKSLNNLTSDAISIGQKLLIPSAQQSTTTYTVVSGDSLWTISQKFNTTVTEVKSLNNLVSDSLYIGQKLTIPSAVQQIPQNIPLLSSDSSAYTVIYGDTLWLISQKLNTTISAIRYLNNLGSDVLIPGQVLIVTSSSNISPYTPGVLTTHIANINYVVKSGDNPWGIGQQFKLPSEDILSANNLTTSSSLKIGQVLKIPVHIVPVKQTPAPQYGELLDWWNEAQYVFYTGAIAKVTDFNTGRVFYIKRTIGANHADCETLTLKDTNIMRELWSGVWKWSNRPVTIEVGGRKLAASMAGMPHAGLDSYPALANIYNRSGDYGYGPNFDFIKGNGLDGHFDVHFLNSTRHNSGSIDPDHQAKLHISAGK